MACNDLDDVYFSDAQFEILTELADTLYDAVAFFKHRSEGETNSTFAYVPVELRVHIESLWALDTCWAMKPKHRHVVNFIRNIGGSIHMVVRRYRFVEENLTISSSETAKIIDEARRRVKLWNRVDAKEKGKSKDSLDVPRYKSLVRNSHEELMYHELNEFLEDSDGATCTNCNFRQTHGAENIHRFRGVELCKKCKVA